MGTKSKFFRAFVEGQTVSDKRTITADDIDQIVATFSPDTYSPRINVEHISGYSPEPPFNGYGDVVAVKAQTDDITLNGETQKRRALYCQVDGNDQLVALSKRDQKPYPSVELTADYAGTGKVGLIGLAFTDTPASIATQRLQFARVTGALAFTASDRAALEFEGAAPDGDTLATSIATALGKFFGRGEPEKKKDEPKTTPANDNPSLDITAFSAVIGQQIAAAVKPSNDAVAALTADFTALKTKIESTEAPSGFSRPAAPGGAASVGDLTDC